MWCIGSVEAAGAASAGATAGAGVGAGVGAAAGVDTGVDAAGAWAKTAPVQVAAIKSSEKSVRFMVSLLKNCSKK